MASVCSGFRRQNKLSKVDLCSAIAYLRKVRGYETEVVEGNGLFRISAVCADARAKPFAVVSRMRQASPSSFSQDLSFEFGEDRQQAGHRATGRRG
jgi:hypothetical protein